MYDVLKYIHENIDQRLSLEDTAKRFGYSKWHFCKKFRDYSKQTFVEYIRHYRIQMAALDILAGRKITDVALDYGYDTVSGFNKAFLVEYGCLPREYKNSVKSSSLYYERRRLSMHTLSDRCSILREEVVNKKSHIRKVCAQRHVYFTLGCREAQEMGLSVSEITAAGIVRIINSFRPYIAPGEIIVGTNYGDGPFSETYNPLEDEDGISVMRDNGISEPDIAKFMEIGNISFQSFSEAPYESFTQEELWSEQEWAGIGRCQDSNHSLLNYEKVLKLGFEGILKEVEAYEEINGTNPMYRSMKMICSGACIMGERYAAEAAKMLGKGAGYQDEDLKEIIDICSRVPRHPAGSFREAVQALVFAHIINTWEDYIGANSLGRLDQILYPYYKADLDLGVITKEEAFEIICCLWLKLYREYDVQQSCVGGTSPDGKSMVNDLSYMMLDAIEQLDIIRCLSVRFSDKTEKAFLKRALEVVGHVQKGVPFFFNDDVMIPALIAEGIHPEDAYDYTQMGCVETVIPGKSNNHSVTGAANLLKALEYVFGNGSSLMYPHMHPGVKTGELESFDTFDSFCDAVFVQMKRILDMCCSKISKSRPISAQKAPRPYKSLLTQGCMESGKDFNDTGAKYDFYQVMLAGIPNLADSLMVIKKYVYEEHKYTLFQMKDILRKDYPDESVRQEFITKVPKFGNDIEEVDRIAIEIINQACNILKECDKKYGICFHAQLFTYLWMIDHGKNSAASPDGRHKGEIIAYSVSPMQGRDFKGLTGVLNSVSKLPTKRTAGTCSAIAEVDPKLFTDKNMDVLTDILIASGKKGLSNVQFNTVDADTLMDAQKYPEKHKSLAVRVSGFSLQFHLLSPELQNHIIERTKHKYL